MHISDKQRTILKHLRNNQQISKYEDCVFCGENSNTWHEQTNTPICESCSNQYAIHEIPFSNKDAVRLMKRGFYMTHSSFDSGYWFYIPKEKSVFEEERFEENNGSNISKETFIELHKSERFKTGWFIHPKRIQLKLPCH